MSGDDSPSATSIEETFNGEFHSIAETYLWATCPNCQPKIDVRHEKIGNHVKKLEWDETEWCGVQVWRCQGCLETSVQFVSASSTDVAIVGDMDDPFNGAERVPNVTELWCWETSALEHARTARWEKKKARRSRKAAHTHDGVAPADGDVAVQDVTAPSQEGTDAEGAIKTVRTLSTLAMVHASLPSKWGQVELAVEHGAWWMAILCAGAFFELWAKYVSITRKEYQEKLTRQLSVPDAAGPEHVTGGAHASQGKARKKKSRAAARKEEGAANGTIEARTGLALMIDQLDSFGIWGSDPVAKAAAGLAKAHYNNAKHQNTSSDKEFKDGVVNIATLVVLANATVEGFLK